MKMLMSLSILILLTSAFVAGQRGSFAGSRPIGFPDTPNRTTTTPDPLGNRFGEGTTERLPIEANGDRDLIDRLSKLPIDQQPFWFINWQALEAHRKNPQTYPQRPNTFVDPIIPQNSNNGNVNNRFSTANSGFVSTTAGNLLVNRLVPTTVSNQANENSNSQLGNRNGGLEQTTDSFQSQNSGNINQESNPQINTNSKVTSNSNSELGNRNSRLVQTTDSFGSQYYGRP